MSNFAILVYMPLPVTKLLNDLANAMIGICVVLLIKVRWLPKKTREEIPSPFIHTS